MEVSMLRTGTVQVNGTELYYERRGSGPSVLFIQGATGDAGTFSEVAGPLADQFTIVTYDRRCNSRSPRPVGWTGTSIEEQADDAAGLIDQLDLAPAAVFGTSGGAQILLGLLVRRPEVVRGALVHEPPLVPLLPNAAEVGAQLQARVEQGFARGGPRAAMEMFLRSEAGDANFERLDPVLRERMLGNADLFFSIEMPMFAFFVPDVPALAQVNVPIQILAGRDDHGVYTHVSAEQLAERLGLGITEIPGSHTPYLEYPRELAEALRPLLREMS